MINNTISDYYWMFAFNIILFTMHKCGRAGFRDELLNERSNAHRSPIGQDCDFLSPSRNVR